VIIRWPCSEGLLIGAAEASGDPVVEARVFSGADEEEDQEHDEVGCRPLYAAVGDGDSSLAGKPS